MGLTQVSTDGVKNDAITKTKIPANQIEASELADNAVDTNAIADQAVALSKLPHGDGSSNGKFLRANNGADPSFETVSIPAGTTINNNADNRVITGDASANTLNGESNVVIDSSGRLLVGTGHSASRNVGDLTAKIQLEGSGYNQASLSLMSNAGGSVGNTPHFTMGKSRGSSNGDNTIVADGDVLGQFQFAGADGTDCNTVACNILGRVDGTPGSNDMPGALTFQTTADGAASPTERLRIDSSGNVGIGTTSPDQRLHIYHATDNGLLHLESGDSQARIKLKDNAGETHLGAVGNDTVFWQSSSLTERLRIQSGGGISFNGDTAAANALDDYEEGSFSPIIRTIGSSTGQKTGTGRYTKIGHQVMCQFQFDDKNCSAIQNNNYIQIANIPFTAASYPCTSTVPHAYNIDWNGDRVQCFITSNNTTVLEGYESRSGGSWQYWVSNNFRKSQIYLRFNLTYFTNS